MFVRVLPVHIGRVDGHGAVQIDRNVRNEVLAAEPGEVEHEGFRAADGERGDHDNSPAFGDAGHHRAKLSGRVLIRVASVAVRRFSDKNVRGLQFPGREHEGIVGTAQVSREVYGMPVDIYVDLGGAEDVSGWEEGGLDAISHFKRSIKIPRLE